MFTIRKLLFLFMVGSITANESDPVTVTVPNGPILGHELLSYKNNTYYGFQEIPYAFPPTDDFRFKDPIPMKAWVGTWDATKNTKVCYQTGSHHTQKTVQTEDCLYLNVYTPVKPGNNASLLPVLFWIHGGGFRWGDGTYQYYGPDYFVDYDIIVVTINYRLGPFGFLTTADGTIPANLGLKDQNVALNWTHSNIQYFGGDPEKITIVGESSGGQSVGHLILSKKSRGLFRGAILQSGTALCSEAHQDYAKYFAYQLGSALNQNFTTKNSSEELLQLLQSASAEDIMSINITIPSGMENKLGDGRGMVWTPVIEDEGLENAFVVGPMQENLKNGDINKVPIMIGFNSEEELHFLGDFANWTQSLMEMAVYFDEDLSRLIENKFNMTAENKQKAGSELRNIYTDGLFQDDIPALIKFLSDEAFTTPLTRHAELQSNYTDVYLYQFSYKGAIGSGSVTVKDVETVGHFEELHYMWDFHDIVNETSVRDTLMHHRLLKLWTNFVKYLNPTPSEDVLLNGVIWPKVSPTNITYYDINTAIEVRTDPRRYKDWKPIIEKYAIPPLANY